MGYAYHPNGESAYLAQVKYLSDPSDRRSPITQKAFWSYNFIFGNLKVEEQNVVGYQAKKIEGWGTPEFKNYDDGQYGIRTPIFIIKNLEVY